MVVEQSPDKRLKPGGRQWHDAVMPDTRGALVTGGATGLGLGVATRLVAEGTSVVLVGRTPARLEAGAATLRAVAANGAQIALGKLVACVAAAGTGSFGNLVDTTAEQWPGVIATNLTGAFFTLREAAKAMVAHGQGGSIVLVSSIAGVRTHRLMGPYCVSKAGLDMLAMNAADELGASAVRVNTVRPVSCRPS
jgi:NAD(P)-dependent dehydrogenase (short-subunit alcohol dehydrogenase family)